MVPLIVLVIVTLLARLVGQFGTAPLRDWAAATRVGLAVMFCFTSAAHFNSMRADMVRMVPPAVPNPEAHGHFHRRLRDPRRDRPARAAHASHCRLRADPVSHRRATRKHPRGTVGRHTTRRTCDTAHSQNRASGALHCPHLVVWCSSAQRAHRPERR